MTEQEIKAKGWDAYRTGAAMTNPYKARTWRALAWQEGYNAAERDAAHRLYRRYWDSQAQYGPLPPAAQPCGSDVYGGEAE